MKTIRFTRDPNYDREGGHDFKEGDIVTLRDDQADRWTKRNAAVQISSEEQEVVDRSPHVPTREELDAALKTLPGEYDDSDYVVRQMRGHFKEVFTVDDEAHIRKVVVAKVKTQPAVKTAKR